MTKTSYAWPLLSAGAVGLAVTCFAAPSLERPAVATAISLPEPTRAPNPATVPEAPPAAPAAPAAGPAPAVVRSPEAEAGRAQACQAEFEKVSQANPIDFGRDRHDLSPKARTAVEKLMIVARACSGLRIEVGAHTDSQGKRRNNVNLSKKRADAVRDYLVELGLSPDLLTAVGFGPDRPVASNRTSSGREKNRRIEFRVSRVE